MNNIIGAIAVIIIFGSDLSGGFIKPTAGTILDRVVVHDVRIYMAPGNDFIARDSIFEHDCFMDKDAFHRIINDPNVKDSLFERDYFGPDLCPKDFPNELKNKKSKPGDRP